MYKRPFVSFAFLFTFWIIISGVVNLQHIMAGIILSVLIVWFWKGFDPKLPNVLSFRELLLFGRCIIKLIGYVILANFEVIKILLFSSQALSPMILEMELGVESDWGRVFLATCITITPGTVTIDFDPENKMFTIHALTRATGESLYHWDMINEINNLEQHVQRRKTHALDTGGIHDSDSISSI